MTAMKAYTSRERFDESRRFVAVHEEMGRYRLDADANEHATLRLTDSRRRSADLAEGSPDDGFALVETFLVDAITSTAGWSGSGLAAGDLREIPPELRLERRDPETLPHVLRSRGHLSVRRVLPAAVDLLAVPEPGHHAPAGATWSAADLQVRLRLDRRANDDEVALTRLVLRDADGTWHDVLDVPADHRDGVLSVPIGALGALERGTGADRSVVLTGWGFTGLPPRADTDIDALVATDAALGADLVVRGGGGTPGTAGRLYAAGHRAFIEADWRYSTQPYLPDPVPLAQPGADESVHHVLDLDLVEREVHAWQDLAYIAEPALDGDPSTFRRQQVVQIRARRLEGPLPASPSGLAAPESPTSDGRLTSDVPAGVLPDRNPPEEPDRCRDRCLYTEQVSTGEGYLGTTNANVRVEVLAIAGAVPRAVLWSRDNASLVAPLAADLPADGLTLTVGSFHAARFRAGDVVTLEDEAARLDGADPRHHPVVRRLRSVDTATGRLELEPTGHLLADDPAPLPGGGGPGRALRVADLAAVRRWDGADWLVPDVRYRLVDNITFAFSGAGFRHGEHWLFTARVVAPDGAAAGVVERRVAVPPDGPHHIRVPLALVTATRGAATAPVVRTITDLRERFLPLREVRDRLIELGARHLAPGAFTVVVGDGQRTFGHIDQNLAEGVTGDEAVHAALAELAGRPGTIYLRAGTYVLEHPVVLQNLSGVRIVGDGAATRLEVRGAGGAFVLDGCGDEAPVALELMDLVEIPEAEVPIGADDDGGLVGDLVPADDGGGALGPGDVLQAGGGLEAVLDAMRDRIATLAPGGGRASASVVATVLELRRLQRTHPGRPLEDVAPDQLETLRHLPHGVVSVGDSRDVLLGRLRLFSTERGGAGGTVAAGVLLTGTLSEISVTDCAVRAASGVVAAPLARFLSPAALAQRPRSGLFVHGLRIVGNDLRSPVPGTGTGLRIADGVLDGVVVRDNDIDGWGTGILLEDRAEARHGESIERTAVADNRLTDIGAIGVDVAADGVELDRNEIRLAAAAAALRAGVRVSGTQVRVTGCTVELPPTAPGQPVLGLEAGVVVGSGVDAGSTLDRVVSDVVVADTRVSGAGAATIAHGIVVGGAGAVVDVTASRCDLRHLGGSGVRSWGHAGAVGALRVLDCTVEQVATAGLEWSGRVVSAAAALVPSASGSSPRLLLESLLAATGGEVRPALDGLLRWVEQATLRAGVALSLVDDAVVTRNRIRGVGRIDLPAQLPGADVHVAGVAVLGGDEHRVSDNDVSEVHGAVRRTAFTASDGVVRPGIVDTLEALPAAAAGAAGDLHGAVVGLRALAHDYAVARGRAREQIGRRIYAAMEAVGSELAERGGQSARLGARLADAIEEMRDAQGDADHTAAANLVRVVISHAAQLTAPDDATAEVWGYAARVDAAMTTSSDELVAAAQDVADAAPALVDGLQLDLDLAALAAAVVGSRPGSQEQETAALALAGALGDVASARLLTRRARSGGVLSAQQAKLLGTVLNAVSAAVAAPASAALTDAAVDGMADGIDSLVSVLSPSNPTLASTVRQRYERLRRGQGAPPAGDVDALRAALDEVQSYLADPQEPPAVGAADVETDREAAHGQLVMLTAGWVDRQLASLSDRDESAETRSLRLLSGSVTQLSRLVGDHRELSRQVDDVQAAVRAAAAEPRDRARHKADAARALAALRAAQATAVDAQAPVAAVLAPTQVAERLAGLGQLVLDLRSTTGREDRAIAAAAFENQLRRSISSDVALPEGDRRRLLEEVSALARPLARPGGGAERARALHRAASALAEVAEAASEQVASSQADAVATLVGVLVPALEPSGADDARLLTARRYVTARRDTLSPSGAQGLLVAPDVGGLLARVDSELAAVTELPSATRPVIAPPELVQPLPADAVLAARVAGSLSVTGNRLASGRRGIAIGDSAGHPLAPLPRTADLDGPPGAVEVAVVDNTVRAAVLAGIALDLDVPARIRVDGNDLQGCGGAATQPADSLPLGRAILDVHGHGQLALRDNRLDGNGSSTHPDVVHGIAVLLEGDAAVTGNRVRHAGGQRGGAGVVVVSVAVPEGGGRQDGRSWDLSALVSEPFLEVDAPPRPPRPPLRPVLGPLNPTLARLVGPVDTGAVLTPSDAGLAGVPGAGIAAGVAATTFAATRPPALSLLTTPVTAAATVTVADLHALRWLAPAVPEPTPAASVATLRPVLDFLRRPPAVLIPIPIRPVRRSLQVSGNDVVSEGAALLALGSDRIQLGAAVSGNTFVSTGRSGAVYLRDVDSCVVGSNRVESPAAVTVMVVRALAALVSINGNVFAGREPPLSPVIRPRPLPTPDVVVDRPAVRLDLDLARELGGSLSVELDPATVLAGLRGERDTTAAKESEKAAASFDSFARRNQIVTDPKAAFVLETASQHGLLDVDLSREMTVKPRLNLPSGIKLDVRRAAVNRLVRRVSGGTLPVVDGASLAAPAAADPGTGDTADTGPTVEPTDETTTDDTGDEPDLAVRLTRLTEDFGRILADGGLSPGAKLFGVAKSSGVPETVARSLVQEHLTRNHGDAEAALRSGLGALTGVETPAAATPTRPTSALPLLESVLGSVLDRGATAITPRPTRPGIPPTPSPLPLPGSPTIPTPRPFPLPTPGSPTPRQHTLVVLGGAQVAVAGNATTAGAHVRPAEQTT